MTATVVNKRARGFKPNANQRYIGRGSLFGNPFTHLPLGRTKARFQVKTAEESMICFEAWFRERLANDVSLRQKLLDLDGHELVCYCRPAPCHGEILIKLIEELKLGGDTWRQARCDQSRPVANGQRVVADPGRKRL
jgi:hypothetical protein